MSVVELYCPKCGATIHAEEDLTSFDCPCCGNRIVLHTQTDASVVRSAPTGKTAEKPMKTKKRKSPLRGIVAAILAAAVLCGAGYFGLLKYTEKEIETHVKRVQEYIDNQDFSRARTQLSAFDGNWLFKAKWESAKEALLEEISYAENEYNLNQQQAQEEQETSLGQDAFYPVPMSPIDAQNKDVDEIKSKFEDAHFKNIRLEPITIVDAKEAKKADNKLVKEIRITVDNKEVSLKKNELLRADAKITIIFYDFSNSLRVPMSSKDAIGMKYEEVETIFIDADFNVICEEYKEEQGAPVLEGIKNAWKRVTKPFTKTNSGKVQAITIKYNGEIKTDFGEGARVPSDSEVTITYY